MIYALYHFEPETLGEIASLLEKKRLPYKEIRLYTGDSLPTVADTDALIVMGGPMSVNDTDTHHYLEPEIKLVGQAINKGLPVLGICLGAQIIAKALGSKIYPNNEKEVGWYPISLTKEAADDRLFKETPNQLTVLHWHGETFDLPKGATLLARSSRCENQVFRYGNNTYGFQFHLETNPDMVRTWALSEQGKADIQSAGENSERILAQSNPSYTDLKPYSEKIFNQFIDCIESHTHAAIPK